jgi:hypothetical protein
MRSIGRISSVTLAVVFLALSLTSVSVSMKAMGFDLATRGESLISVWEDITGLFAFGYHPVSATDLAQLSSSKDSLCPEFGMSGQEGLAFSHSIEKRCEPWGSAKDEVASVDGSYRCKEDASMIDAINKKRTPKRLSAARFPVQSTDVAEIIRTAYTSGVEELRHTNEFARFRFGPRRALRVSQVLDRADDVLVIVPAVEIKSSALQEAHRRVDSTRRSTQLLKSYAPAVPAVRKCES